MTKAKRDELLALLGAYTKGLSNDHAIDWIDQHFIEKDALAEEIRKMRVDLRTTTNPSEKIHCSGYNAALDHVLDLLELLDLLERTREEEE